MAPRLLEWKGLCWSSEGDLWQETIKEGKSNRAADSKRATTGTRCAGATSEKIQHNKAFARRDSEHDQAHLNFWDYLPANKNPVNFQAEVYA